jgi:8-oxo-dGTP diphosphatase
MSSDDEWWDILDTAGTPTGEILRRGAERWPSGRFHLIVAVCVQRDNGAILLTQRAAGKEFAYGREFPGGSALTGESSREAASRELWEETGLAVEPSALTSVSQFVETSALLDFHVARVTSDAEPSLQHSEVMAAQWVTPEEVIHRLGAGLFAHPWMVRLETLWLSITQELDADR